MKLVYGITKANWGGAQAYVLALAKAAQARGWEPVIVAGEDISSGGGHGALAERAATAGIRFSALRAIRRNLGVGAELRAVAELVRVLRTERPDVVHVNSSKMGVLGAIATRYVRRGGYPRIIFTAHGWAHREPRGLLWKAVAWAGSLITVLLADRTIAVSAVDQASSPAPLMRQKITCVPNGIPTFELRERADARAAILERAPAADAYPVWLYQNAELHQNKGIDASIRALAMLATNRPDLALMVCGEGEERERLTALAQELGVANRVFLLGFVPDARGLLSAADLYLMPSRKEGLPMALLEAGHAALPTIAARTGGIPDVVEHGVTGCLIPPADPAALAAAVASLLDDPARAQALGIALRARVDARFSEARMVEETFATYST